MKQGILPTLVAGLMCAAVAAAQEQRSETEPPDQQPHSQQQQLSTETSRTEVQQRDSTRFELRQDAPATSAEARPSPQTSPEAGALADNAQVISLREAPGPVRRHIERQAAFVPLQRIVKQTQGDKSVYEATFEGTTVETKLLLAEDGKTVRVHVASASPVVYEAAGAQRHDRERQPDQMQRAAMDRLQQQIGGAQIQSIQPRTVYDVNVLHPNGQPQQIWVYEDGTILR